MAIPVAMLVGAPVSAALLKMDGVMGLRGWQWLFFVEGLPAVVLGIIALRWLTDRPEKATWLPREDREWLSQEMERERAERNRRHVGWGALKNPRILLLCIFYFLNNSATYGVFFFLPDILAKSSGFTGFKLAAITSLPFAFALAGMILIGRHSDRTGERKWHVAVCAFAAAAGLALAAWAQGSIVLLVLCVTISQVGQRSLLSVFWAIPPMLLGGTAAAAGIAIINSLGTLGGQAGPWMMGKLRQGSTGYTSGLLALAVTLALEAIVIASLRMSPPKVSEPK
jgi:ACS family tartrate transporter-like MFS transporter